MTFSETAESFLTASSITRTRQIHQITARSVYQLLKAAYTDYCTEAAENSEEVLSFDVWCEKRKLESPQFQFWHLLLFMELAILLLVRAVREANFSLYCQSLAKLMPYFFANNNTNYSRWLFRDMVTLKEKHPQLAQEFESGKFVVYKSSRDFSAMAIDQAHDQANAVIKADWGVVGVTEDPSALRRWMELVFDVYQLSSLKAETRTKRGHGVRRRVTSKGKIPQNWQNFLRDNDNKTELFNFLAQKIAQMSTPNIVIVTKEDDVASNCSQHGWSGSL